MLWRTPLTGMWSPWGETARVHREMERLLGRVGRSPFGHGEFPAVNVWSGEDRAVLTAELPGIDPDKLEITVKEEVVTLKGAREASALNEGETHLRRERGTGTFSRAFSLPFRIDPEGVEAHYSRGILELVLPRAETDKPRKIMVKAS